MLADPERVDAHPVGEDALLHHVSEDLRVVDGPAVPVDGGVAEGVEAKGDLARGDAVCGGHLDGG